MYNGVYDIEQFAYLHEPLMKWIALKISGKSIAENLLARDVREISIYGIHELGKLIYSDLASSEIIVNCFIDKRSSEYPDGYKGIPVISMDQLKENDSTEFILVTPEFYFHDILNDLLKNGIAIDKILSMSMIV